MYLCVNNLFLGSIFEDGILTIINVNLTELDFQILKKIKSMKKKPPSK